LARWQADEVARRIEASPAGEAVTVELVLVETSGDRRQDIPVWEMGGQGVFVKEVQAAVLDGRADLAVHSAKDLPSAPTPGLTLAAVPVRADPRDALVGAGLDDLVPGAPVATGSVRRRAQLAWIRPDLTFTGLRGNIATRLSRVPAGGAMVVAVAALERLGLLSRATQILAPDVMLPQVGQGAIAVECGHGQRATLDLLSVIDDRTAHAALDVERAFLARLGSGCDLPVGAYARVDEPTGALVVSGLMASGDGRVVLRASDRRIAPDLAGRVGLGQGLAEALLAAGGADLLESGGSDVLAAGGSDVLAAAG
jgi:hydroxymethylbilane synthase